MLSSVVSSLREVDEFEFAIFSLQDTKESSNTTQIIQMNIFFFHRELLLF